MKKDKDLSYLLVAGGTLLFYMCILPVVDTFSTMVQNKINLKNAKMQKNMVQIQQEIEAISGNVDEESNQTHAIGFQIDGEEEQEWEEE